MSSIFERDVLYQSFIIGKYIDITLKHKGRSTFVQDIYHFKYGPNEPIICGIRYERRRT